MAQTPQRQQKRTNRRKRGFEAASSLLAQRVQKAAEGRGFAVTRLLTHWPEIAGEQLARATRPIRISHSRGGFGATLTLLTSGPAAPMVEMQLPQLRERVNACYGYNAIQKIVLTQTAATGFAEGQAQFTPAPPRIATPPDPQAEARAHKVAAQFEDPHLAEAMARLALNLSSRKNRKDS
ncbi:DUF721 domain-containing protein [Paracoccus saliphilus]|uniref:DUF721 domain-containing protein n=1 Tax=Paracoccus saliphilus TaxID=405559 RepID=A0AA45W0I2_9RHOB|nr:DUF721 domain-containing protein [Paracoccus saliphilus]WCR05441.1 DUF721 domain-containing protein [Paracoccus saliphilus]SIS49192.1 hypothetical protein SAMN05421772_1016 [Paracoccus saliphilus]